MVALATRSIKCTYIIKISSIGFIDVFVNIIINILLSLYYFIICNFFPLIFIQYFANS